MTDCAFMGDAVTGAGFRLAGVAVFEPTAAEAPALFERLCASARLILITAEAAAWLPAGRLSQAQRVVAPDQVAAPRRQMGLSA